MTQQIHSFRASGVSSCQAACVVASERSAIRKSVGVLCTGLGLPALLPFIPQFSYRLILKGESMLRCPRGIKRAVTTEFYVSTSLELGSGCWVIGMVAKASGLRAGSHDGFLLRHLTAPPFFLTLDQRV